MKSSKVLVFLLALFLSTLSRANGPRDIHPEENIPRPLKDNLQVIYVAVASDFLNTFKKIETEFTSQTPYKIVVSSGATAHIFMQINNGAPYDIFFSADTKHPSLLKESGHALAEKSYIYAIGKLVLWAPNQKITEHGKNYLNSGNYQHLAIANPRVAPYGIAALQAIRNLSPESTITSKIIQGENAGQTFNFIATHNADAGFVGLSQVLHYKKQQGQTGMEDIWQVPENCYHPIRQEVVLLKNAAQKSVAIEMMDFIKQERIQTLIKDAGYELNDSN